MPPDVGMLSKFFSSKLSLSSAFLILLAIAYFFAPLVATSNPEFQKNINVTKLLPPFSSVIQITTINKSENDNKPLFFSIKDKVIKNSFNDNILFADTVKIASSLIYYQKGLKQYLPLSVPFFVNDEYKIEKKLFLLGTDEYGRDIWSRLVYGARVSITIGFLSVLITALLGIITGFFAGYKGGLTDSFLNRFSEMLLSFPLIFLIILIIALFGNSVISVIIVLGFSGWMSLFKIVRTEIISLKGKDYFLTAKLMGLGSTKLIFAEMLPVIAAPVIVNLVFQFGNVILAESALSYLGLGTGGVYPSWGSMIQSGQSYLGTAWWMILFPGFALFLTLLLTNNLGSSVKYIFNPRLGK